MTPLQAKIAMTYMNNSKEVDSLQVQYDTLNVRYEKQSVAFKEAMIQRGQIIEKQREAMDELKMISGFQTVINESKTKEIKLKDKQIRGLKAQKFLFIATTVAACVVTANVLINK
jgi:hypothetical protein